MVTNRLNALRNGDIGRTLTSKLCVRMLVVFLLINIRRAMYFEQETSYFLGSI